ncbi:MAG: hypothetical protein EOP48_09640 [Sphingobacteriales bacterium]|nr:MAG: hypothetical protein EOP48_09640 [Sphingobacteriales bacterium]
MNLRCVVVFPLYRQPDTIELAFLTHGVQVLKDFDIVIAAPDKLILTPEFGALSELKIIRFQDHFFSGINGYNRLLLSKEFYTSFSAYEYVLIHQADVYIFKNELLEWCNRGYAYIGPPWLRSQDNILKQNFNRLRKLISKNYGFKHNKVGNGGFSLRNTAQALKVLSMAPAPLLTKFKNETHHSFNEDVFWSFEAPRISTGFRIPDMVEALHFGIEFEPEKAIELLNGELPFGCHAPIVQDLRFWKRHIPELKHYPH